MLAPILISVYNRKESLFKCIEHLARCNNAKESDLYIVSDAAYRLEDVELIESIRKEIQNIKGFKKVYLIKREVNMGSFLSINNAITEVINKYGKIIFLEDDIRVSKYFLEYMNKCLDKFEKENNVYSISGYLYPLKKMPDSLKEDIFLWKHYCPWGMATWKDRWEKIDWDLTQVNMFLKNKDLVTNFNHIEPNSIDLLKKNYEGKIKTGDTITSFHMFMNNMYSVYPIKTLTVNRGHDGTGEHCSGEKKYYQQQYDDNFLPDIEKSICKENKEMNDILYRYHYSFILQVVKPILKRLGLFNLVNNIRHKIRNKIKKK